MTKKTTSPHFNLKARSFLKAIRDPAPSAFYEQEVFVVLDWSSGSFRWTTDTKDLKSWEYVIMLPENRRFAHVIHDEPGSDPFMCGNWIMKRYSNRVEALTEHVGDFVADVSAMK